MDAGTSKKEEEENENLNSIKIIQSIIESTRGVYTDESLKNIQQTCGSWLDGILTTYPEHHIPDAFKKIFNEIIEYLSIYRYARVALCGQAGVGKSSLLNAIVPGADAKIGKDNPTTTKPTWKTLPNEKGEIELLDTVGLYDGNERKEVAGNMIINEDKPPDFLMCVISPSDLRSNDYRILKEFDRIWKGLCEKDMLERKILVVINKCDRCDTQDDDKEWHEMSEEEKLQLRQSLEKRAREMFQNYSSKHSSNLYDHIAKDGVIAVCAQMKKLWRIEELIKQIFDLLPNRAKISFVRVTASIEVKKQLCTQLVTLICDLGFSLTSSTTNSSYPIYNNYMIVMIPLKLLLSALLKYIAGKDFELIISESADLKDIEKQISSLFINE